MRTLHLSNPGHRNGFTMLELIFVIVVLGILAAIALPRLDKDNTQDAANHILSNIRHTQHLAMMDFKHEFDDPQWQRKFWRIVFSTCTGTDRFFMIGSDDDKDGSLNALFDRNESAIDPITGNPMFWVGGTDCSTGTDGTVSKDIFISHKFGVTQFASAGGCANAAHIAFDHLGRPHHGAGFSNSVEPNYGGYMNARCTFTFTMSNGDTFDIHIEPETGYAFIDGQDGS